MARTRRTRTTSASTRGRELEDERNFGGLYVQADWQPTDRFNIVAGLRFNHTDEDQEGEVVAADEEKKRSEEGGATAAPSRAGPA
jgi:outer membrane receptor protein involved in Fe transport